MKLPPLLPISVAARNIGSMTLPAQPALPDSQRCLEAVNMAVVTRVSAPY